MTQILDLPSPYVLFLGSVTEPAYAKTALGLRDWARVRCLGEHALSGATVSTGLPAIRLEDAVDAGARSLVIGVAARGGALEPAWIPALVQALESGLDLVSGMHERLGQNPQLAETAERLGRRLVDVRVPPSGLPVGTGRKRTGKRLLTVGTDCALGKKYTALALANAFQERGIPADFRATGQTGIMIAGRGIPMDAVVSDFLAGAAEQLSPDAAADHWDVIEGQGALFHPAFAGVSLGLLHGSQPDVIVICHQPGRDEVVGSPGFALPALQEAIDLNLRLGSRTNPAIRCAGISLNTAGMADAQAEQAFLAAEVATGLPAADPIRGGARFGRLVAACLA